MSTPGPLISPMTCLLDKVKYRRTDVVPSVVKFSTSRQNRISETAFYVRIRRSYILSKSRARAANSTFMMLANEDEKADFLSRLQEYKKIEKVQSELDGSVHSPHTSLCFFAIRCCKTRTASNRAKPPWRTTTWTRWTRTIPRTNWRKPAPRLISRLPRYARR